MNLFPISARSHMVSTVSMSILSFIESNDQFSIPLHKGKTIKSWKNLKSTYYTFLVAAFHAKIIELRELRISSALTSIA